MCPQGNCAQPVVQSRQERRNLIRPLIGATTTCELIAPNNAVQYCQPAPSPWTGGGARRQRHGRPGRAVGSGSAGQGRTCRATGPVQSAGLQGVGTGTIQSRREISVRIVRLLRSRTVIARLGGRPGRAAMAESDRDAHLYVGNLHQHRTSFSALGVWSPKREEPDLFDSGALGYT